MQFCEVETIHDECPIVLVDYSGSTGDTFKDNNNVLEYEIELVSKILSSKNINKLYFMLWDNKAYLPFEESSIDIKQLETLKIGPRGGTDLVPALESISKNWIKDKKVCDIYIFTDGEISNNKKIKKIINDLLTDNIRIFINTVEANDDDYLNENCSAGNTLYRIIKENSLTLKIKKFSSYNRKYDLVPFVNYDNPDVAPNYASFRGQYFRIDKTSDFIIYLEEIIKEANKERTVLLKIVHELIVTLYYLTKDKSIQVKKSLINIFSDLFANTPIYNEIRQILLNELDNHIKGQSTTFQEYRNAREKVFEAVQLSLYKDVLKSICNKENINFLTMIINMKSENDYIVRTSEDNITEKIILSDKVYNHAGLKIDKYSFPVLPTEILMDDDIFDQAIRQWIRSNYSKKYSLNPASDVILYYFLADVFRILLSNVSDNTKNTYRNLTYLMLERKRFGTTITEYNYLLNNPPAPVSGNEDKINYILNETINHFNKNLNNKIKPFTFWYGFIKAFDDKKLCVGQLPFCQNDMLNDNLNEDNILDYFRSNFKNIIEINKATSLENEYYCYISLEDTTITGGYRINPHKISNSITCSPRFVLSDESYNLLINTSEIKCPICYKQLEENDFIKIQPKEEISTSLNELSENNKSKDINISEIDEKFYDTSKFELVDIDESMYRKDDDHELIEMNKCNFDVNSYRINAPIVQDPISNNVIGVKTQEEFNDEVKRRYPFLLDINFEGACLAGGFCRSIMLKQKMKDFDIFLFGDKYEENFRRILKEILEVFKKDEKVKFLLMFKELYNVFEVVIINDPNDFFKDDYKLDNFKEYEFKSMKLFNHDVIINVETGQVLRNKNRRDDINLEKETINDIENEDFSNYFEDGDISGIRMKYRFQFILTKNLNMEAVLEEFDFYPSRVAWDGNKTWFSNKSVHAYKYMVNVLNEHNYSELFYYRLSKYFTYGFSPVLPELDLKHKDLEIHDYDRNLDQRRGYVNHRKNIFKLGDFRCRMHAIIDKYIMVEHNSHVEEKLKYVEELERKNLEKGKYLYKSSLFCSLVSLLRYVKINDVSYKMTREVIIPDENGVMEFREKKDTVKFIDRIESRISTKDWYGHLRIQNIKPYLEQKWHYNGQIEEEFQIINGKKEGVYNKWHDNGHKYIECNYINDQKEGLNREWYNNGKKCLEVNYFHDKIEGLYQKWHENGRKKIIVNYINNQKEGLYQEWHSNGKLALEINYVNDKIEGLYKKLDQYGNLEIIVIYTNGIKEGLYQEFENNREWRNEECTDYIKRTTCNYINDKKEGLFQKWSSFSKVRNIKGTSKIYKSNETKILEVNYINNMKEGLYQEWSISGNKIKEENYINDNIDGLSQEWYSDGNIREEINYSNGQRNGLYQQWSYKNNQLRIKCNYINNKKHGMYQEWDEKGNLGCSILYENNRIIKHDCEDHEITSEEESPKPVPKTRRARAGKTKIDNNNSVI